MREVGSFCLIVMLDSDDVYKSNELYIVELNKSRTCTIGERNTE
jgi:hypothetical protein